MNMENPRVDRKIEPKSDSILSMVKLDKKGDCAQGVLDVGISVFANKGA
jgi:hypothetical protein